MERAVVNGWIVCREYGSDRSCDGIDLRHAAGAECRNHGEYAEDYGKPFPFFAEAVLDVVHRPAGYFPIFINAEEYGKTRDQLYFEMKEQNVLGRRYFYPLISTFSTYRGLPSATPENLPVATKIANEVICLPMHHALSEDDIERVLNCIVK